jgi:recombination protein RecA
MAKKEVAQPKESNQSVYLNFVSKLKTEIAKGGQDVPGIEFGTLNEIREYIGTGNYMLNAQFSGSLFGGIPNTRSVEIAGESGAGKTFICLNIAAQAQKMGYMICYVDTERAVDKQGLINFGIDITPEKLIYIDDIKTFAQFGWYIQKLVEMKKTTKGEFKIMIILDSIAHLKTEKEIEDLKKGKIAADMGLRAKTARWLFRNITQDLSKADIPMIFTNHTGANIDLFGGTSIQGGGGPLYAASVVLKIAKSALKAKDNKSEDTSDIDENAKTGVILRVGIDKNRLAIPFDARIHISYNHGMNPYVGIHEHISWENCGVDIGRIMKKAEYDKLIGGKGEESKKWAARRVEFFTAGEGTKTPEEYAAVLWKDAKTIAVRAEAKNVDKKNLFTSEVFSLKTLIELDEKLIKPKFRYKDINELAVEELAEVTEDFLEDEESNVLDENPADLI